MPAPSNAFVVTMESPATGDGAKCTNIMSILAKPSVHRRVALIGDSITDMCGGTRLDGSEQSHFTNGYWSWASILTFHAFSLAINAGVAGNTTSQMAARFQSDIAAYAPHIVVVFGGINDVFGITGSANRDSIVAAAKANLAAIYDAAEAIGAVTASIPLLPVAFDYNGSGLSAQQRIGVSQLNLWIRQQAFARNNLIVADMGAAFSDPSKNYEPFYANNGYPAYLNDGLHPAASGAFVMGRILANAIAPLALSGGLLQGNAEATNLFTNPALLGASGGNGPTSWTINRISGTGSVAYSYIPRTDGISGNWLTIEIAANGQYKFEQSVGQPIATGDQYKISIEYQQAGTTGTTGHAVALDVDVRQPNAAHVVMFSEASDGSMTSGGTSRIVDVSIPLRSGILESPLVTVPSQASGGFMQVILYLFGEGTWSIGRISCVKIN